MLTQEQVDELYAFDQGLSKADEWLFFHLAWVTGDQSRVTNEDKYEVMQRWDELKRRENEDE